MKNFTSQDGLLLSVIKCNRKKINLEAWLSTMDYIDRSDMTVKEINSSLDKLQAGNLILIKNDKIYISLKAAKLLRGGFFNVINWQLKVRKEIVKMQYDETLLKNDISI